MIVLLDGEVLTATVQHCHVQMDAQVKVHVAVVNAHVLVVTLVKIVVVIQQRHALVDVVTVLVCVVHVNVMHTTLVLPVNVTMSHVQAIVSLS